MKQRISANNAAILKPGRAARPFHDNAHRRRRVCHGARFFDDSACEGSYVCATSTLIAGAGTRRIMVVHLPYQGGNHGTETIESG